MAELVCCAFSPDPRVNGSLPCLVLGRQGGCSSRLSLSWAPLEPAAHFASFSHTFSFPRSGVLLLLLHFLYCLQVVLEGKK